MSSWLATCLSFASLLKATKVQNLAQSPEYGNFKLGFKSQNTCLKLEVKLMAPFFVVCLSVCHNQILMLWPRLTLGSHFSCVRLLNAGNTDTQ